MVECVCSNVQCVLGDISPQDKESSSAPSCAARYIDNGGDTDDRKVSVLDGLNEGGYWWLDSQLQPGVDAMMAALRWRNVAVAYHRVPGGLHNELAWAARVDKPLRYLLGTTSP